jgi:hypothetical protein
MKTKTPPGIRIGLFGIGLDTYWPQFAGLLDRLTGYQKEIAAKLRSFGVDLVDAGLVDNPVKAREAASLFQRQEVEFIFLYPDDGQARPGDAAVGRAGGGRQGVPAHGAG